jgi:hypothetical protein
MPTILTRSLRAAHGEVHITQCTDRVTPAVEGVDDVARFDGNISRLMTFRLEAFARFHQVGPTFFLDTDMICLRPLDSEAALQGKDIAICRREYEPQTLVNPHAMGMDLAEYRGKTLDEVYPYLACAVVTRTPDFWAACRDALETMPEKFRIWFGDQEAMRVVVDSGRFTAAWLGESSYACLLDMETGRNAQPMICHFKGQARKPLMLSTARRLGLLGPPP